MSLVNTVVVKKSPFDVTDSSTEKWSFFCRRVVDSIIERLMNGV